jgi:hypothetical protein
MTVPKAGGTPAPLASTQSQPVGVAVNGTTVYWTASSSVLSMPLAGSMATVLATGQAYPPQVAVDSANVYWGTSQGAIATLPLDGGTPTTIATNSFYTLQDVALDCPLFPGTCPATTVFWSSPGSNSLMSVTLDSGTVTTLTSATELSTIQNIAVDATSVYWVTAPAGANSGILAKVPLGGAPSRRSPGGWAIRTRSPWTPRASTGRRWTPIS